MLLLRALLAVAMVLVGSVVLARMVAAIGSGGFSVIPGVVLGSAMIALGLHRLMLIARLRRTS